MEKPTYTLYHNNFSVCSLMVRYTLALCGPAESSTSNIRILQQSIDIFHEEQLSEDFLCSINPKGQVPVLASPSLPNPITDSLDITEFLATFYPSFIPMSHRREIIERLQELHSLNYFSLSFPDRPYVADGFKAAVERRLEGDISEKYQQALTYKLEIINRDKIGGVQLGVPEAMNERARILLEDLESLLPERGPTNEHSGWWLFGLSNATALDAHLIVFIARMFDVGRSNIIPQRLKEYAVCAMAEHEWQNTMQGRKTMVAG